MKLTEYQGHAYDLALPKVVGNVDYMMNGLFSEAGEIAGKFAKYHRGDFDLDELKKRVRPEIGDALWFVACLAEVLGFDLDDIGRENLEKLNSRKERGKLQGDGDSR